SLFPKTRLAAVLVLLYEEDEKLRVLLTTRSKALRTHAGQTALPGGKADEVDNNLVVTAFREAFEEVQLPRSSPDIHLIGLYEPFLSLHKLIVTPVYALLARKDVLNELKPSEREVAKIFTHPLEALLDPQLSQHEASLAAMGSEDWPYETTYYNASDSAVAVLGNSTYRMHRFRTVASPIKGLTSDILIQSAEMAYGKTTIYGRFAPGQIRGFDAVLKASSS
ncbi:Nudix hydrolase 15, mitochondrial, partial [Leucoagaricus sp. SymC.cos]